MILKMIDSSWITIKFGRNSKFFKDFTKESRLCKNDLFYVSAIDIWKNAFNFTNQVPENMDEIFIKYSYIAWIISQISKIITNGIIFPTEIWKFFSWVSELEIRNTIIKSNLEKIFGLLNEETQFDTGDLFGSFLNNILELNIQEEKGMFYTPKILGSFMIEKIIEKHPINSKKKILDPTCGTGSILLEIYQNIESRKISKSEKESIFLQIYGFDENPVAILAVMLNIINFSTQNNYSAEFIFKILNNFRCINIFNLFRLKKNHEFFQTFYIIVGNLPWNVFNNIQDPNVKMQIEEIGKYFNLFMTWKNRSNLEISTVIFKIIQYYLLTPNGFLIFILPASILTGSQHSKFRRFEGLENINVYYIKPDYFPIHSLIFAADNSLTDENFNKQNKKFIPKEINSFYYKFNDHLLKWDLIKKQLELPTFIAKHRRLNLVGKYYSNKFQKKMLPIKKSYYFSKVYRGIDITPRRLLLVKPLKTDKLEYSVSKLVKIKPDLSHATSTQSSTWNFIPYEEATIELSEIKNIVKSTDVIPFQQYRSQLAFLPLKVVGNQYQLKNLEELPPYARNHLELIESVYKSHRIKNSKNKTLYESLSYGNKLYNPNLLSFPKVVYPVGGSYCKAAILHDNTFVIDVTLYYISPKTLDEAYYLLGWLNSKILNRNIPRVSSTGANGSIRVIHMAPWMFPLPKFNNSDLQVEIAKIARSLENYTIELYKCKFSLNVKEKSNLSNIVDQKTHSMAKIYKILRKDATYQQKLNDLDELLIRLFEK